jgi:hypothetical protein
MATRRTREPKELKLVCKCGSCTHWEVVLASGEDENGHFSHQYLVCVKCGGEFDCYFEIGPHEGLHYEKHVKGDEKKADACAAVTA